MLEDKSIIDLDTPASPAILAGIYGVAPSLIYQHAQAGRLPSPIIAYTYRQHIAAYLDFYKNNQEVLLAKEENAQKAREAKATIAKEARDAKHKEAMRQKQELASVDESMHPLIQAKTIQDIKLSIARESKLWLTAQIERKVYVSTEVMTELVEPLIMSIRQTLLSIALESEQVEKQVDLVMDTLYKLGCTLCDQSEEDIDNFIHQAVGRELILDAIDLAEPTASLL